jgi:hypothetical protein
MTFPTFYAEVAYRDGQRDAAAGHSDSRASYLRHGDPEPVGMAWYLKGRSDAAAHRARQMNAELPADQAEVLKLKGMI